jgi:hypothetical protein
MLILPSHNLQAYFYSFLNKRYAAVFKEGIRTSEATKASWLKKKLMLHWQEV